MAGTPAANGVLLHWIPLGAGGRVVPVCGRAYERWSASRQGRAPRRLFHAALEVSLGGTTHVIEMAPAWAHSETERGVVCVGPVGLRPLGRVALFRYEVRCWPHGRIPDLQWAVGEPSILTEDAQAARLLIETVRSVPALTWGRDELRLGEMWNSNGLVAWLLSRAGVDASVLAPPDGGRAPGWTAGLVLAERQALRVALR
jgi:hypothetical protein